MKKVLLKTIITISIASCALVLSSCGKEEVSSEESSILPPYLTPEIVETANNYEYSFNPESVVIKQKETYDYTNSELINLEVTEKRNNHHLVFMFEGRFNEGYAVDPPILIDGNMFLWDDGLYCAKLGDNEVRGYWYNSSLMNKEDTFDCLVLISSQEKYEENIVSLYSDDSYYQFYVPMFSSVSWGNRTILMQGYYYYPDVALGLLKYQEPGNKQNYKIGDYFTTGEYDVLRIMKNLKGIPIIHSEEIVWKIPEDMLDEHSNFYRVGSYIVTAQYKDLEASLTIFVS